MGLLVFQGGLGWYMVKSGLGLDPSALLVYLLKSQIMRHLTNSTKQEKNPDLYGQVRVSPYRLWQVTLRSFGY